MKRNSLSLLAVVLVFTVSILAWNEASRAALCGKCRDLMFIDSVGKCVECGAATASGALQLCPKCSAKRHQCEHCLAATTEADESPAPSAPADSEASKPARVWTAPAASGNTPAPDAAPVERPAAPAVNPLPAADAGTENPTPQDRLRSPKPVAAPHDRLTPVAPGSINPAKAGAYTWGRWRFQLQITNPGTRGEGRWGWLTYDGQRLPRGGVNDYYNTPWGPIYWVDVPAATWGIHGWMPVPLAHVQRQGRALASPRSIATAAPDPLGAAHGAASPGSSAAAASARPRTSVLEINKSHNGQLARLRVGHVLVIRLPGNPATGYYWQVAQANSPAMRLTVRPQYSPSAAGTTSRAAQGTYSFTFQAVQPGSGSIRLYYIRPDDPSQPRDSFTVGVNVLPATATARPVASQGSGR